MKIKRTFLIFSSITVCVIGVLYGAWPDWFALTFLNMAQLDSNIAHILRAVMGLYIALGLFWLYSAFNDKYTNVAVLTTAIFAGGLVVGRLFSLLLDGTAAPILMIYVAMEFALVPIAYWVFQLDE